MKPRDRVECRCPPEARPLPHADQLYSGVRRETARDLIRPAGPSITRTAAAIHTNSSARSAKTCCSHRSAGPTRITPTRLRRRADTYTDEWGVLWKSAPYETRFGSGSIRDGRPPAGRCPRPGFLPSAGPHRPELYHEAERLIAPISATTGSSVLPLLRSSRPPGPTRPGAHADGFRGRPGTRRNHSRDSLPLSPGAAAPVEMGVDMIWTGDE